MGAWGVGSWQLAVGSRQRKGALSLTLDQWVVLEREGRIMLQNSRVRLGGVMVGALVACLCGSNAASGAEFYSIDLSTLRLKIISTTGSVADVWPLGRTITHADPAMPDGHLYAIDSVLGNRVDLLELNRSTGAATFLGAVTDGVAPALGAEALTV